MSELPLGNFNGHLGLLEGESQNLQGVLLYEWLDRCEVNPVSQGSLAHGPTYTYYSGDV